MLNKFLNETEWTKWVIFDSQWWQSIYWKIMSRQLSLHIETTVVILWAWAYSAAFKIFHDYKWKKIMTYWSRGMRHQWHQAIDINDDWSITYLEDKVVARNNKKTADSPYKWMTKKEKKLFIKWKDVYFDFERMKEIFPDIEILK